MLPNPVTSNPVYVYAETWTLRAVTVIGVALFGTTTVTSANSIRIAGVVASVFAFVVNEGLHYLKTNKQATKVISTVETTVDKTVANDPELKAALGQLATSVATLNANLTKGSNP